MWCKLTLTHMSVGSTLAGSLNVFLPTHEHVHGYYSKEIQSIYQKYLNKNIQFLKEQKFKQPTGPDKLWFSLFFDYFVVVKKSESDTYMLT